MRWRIGRRNSDGHAELSKTEARQGDGHDENRPPLAIGTVVAIIGFIIVFGVIWLIRQGGI